MAAVKSHSAFSEQRPGVHLGPTVTREKPPERAGNRL